MSDNNATDILFVGGIDETIDEKSLYDIFSSFGDIRNIEVPLNMTTSKQCILKKKYIVQNIKKKYINYHK